MPKPSPSRNEAANGEPSLSIRLLGGFEIRYREQPVSGFESQNVRALLAYLASKPDRAIGRDRLAGFLWPDEEETTARHNLRQALYNLRRALQKTGLEGRGPIETSPRTISLDTAYGLRIDLLEFEDALRKGRGQRGGLDAHHLARAARIYRGAFLDGFYLRDAGPFEEWLIGERERLQEKAVAALRDLVQHHGETGAYPLGLQYARQLLRLEPFSEETHREMMRLFALSGRRSQAIAHYEEMRHLFQRELGVEPLDETTQLLEEIQDDELQDPGTRASAEPTGPLIPLVGRHEVLGDLSREWQAVGRRAGRVTLVCGEAGIGKTRLLRTFLHEISSSEPLTVLQGRCYELAPPGIYEPFGEALRNAVGNDVTIAERILRGASGETLQTLACLIPELVELEPKLAEARDQARTTPAAVARAISGVLVTLVEQSKRGGQPQPLVLMMDDLHWADRGSFEVLERLLPAIASRPIWVLAAFRQDCLDPAHPLRRLRGDGGAQVIRIHLQRLATEATREVAEALLGPEQGPDLAQFLEQRAAGLPLALVEWINLLWDAGVLEPQTSGAWSLRSGMEASDLPGFDDLRSVIQWRIDKLPPSTRRLLTLAAIVGQKFEAELLQHAEREHDEVVEIGMELLIKHWIVRHFPRYWADSRRERDLALWASGMRRGTFEFAHKSIRRTIYDSLDERRARAIHSQVAQVLGSRDRADDGRHRAMVAYHLLQAGDWRASLQALSDAASIAERLGAHDTALYYYQEMERALGQLLKEGGEAPPSILQGKELAAKIQLLQAD